MNSVINVDLTEDITVDPAVHPYPIAEELLKLVCDEPFLIDTKVEELLSKCKWYAEDNFGCQIKFHTLSTIEEHTSMQLVLKHLSRSVEAKTTFSLVHTRELDNFLKETVKVVAALLPLPYPVCKQCNQQHKCLKCL